MAFQLVNQVHGNGCFVACVAMLLGKTYEEAFRLLHPDANPCDFNVGGLHSSNIGEAVADVLKRLGCKVKPSKLRKINSFPKLARKHAIIIIRWTWGACGEVTEDNPWLCHAVVFDVETKEFLDPSERVRSRDRFTKQYQRQIDSVFYVDPPQAA